MSMKNSSDINGNRTRDLPACSAVPLPTAPPRAPCEIDSAASSGDQEKLEAILSVISFVLIYTTLTAR